MTSVGKINKSGYVHFTERSDELLHGLVRVLEQAIFRNHAINEANDQVVHQHPSRDVISTARRQLGEVVPLSLMVVKQCLGE